MSDTVTHIGHLAFGGTNIEEIKLSESLTHIEDNAFEDLSCKEISLSQSLTYIGNAAFEGNSNLEKIIIPSDTIVSSIYKSGTNNESISIDSLIVNEGVTVGYERSCYANAPYVVLPSTIKQLHSLAFGWGTDEEFRKLKTLICKAVLPPGIGEWYYKDGVKYFNNFMDSYSGNDWHHASECKLIVPAESVELYKQAKYWKNFGIIIPLDE
jgi:hypothetical protein